MRIHDLASTLLFVALAIPSTALAAPGTEQPSSNVVVVNGVRLAAQQRAELARLVGGPILPGRYWYDGRSGLVGQVGGPAVGQLAPGLPVPGELSPRASRGRTGPATGIFLNGREVHPQEAAVWTALVGPGVRGRFWLAPDGSFGRSGGPPLANLAQLYAMRMAALAAAGGAPGYGSTPGFRGAPSGSGDGYFQGQARIGGLPFVSGTIDRSGGGNHVFSVDGEVLNLPPY